MKENQMNAAKKIPLVSLVKRILEARGPYLDNTKCSVVAEVSNETAHGKGTYSSLSKLVGENPSGCDKGKRDNSSVSEQTQSKKKDPSTNSSLDKEKVSSCGSAGTKFSSPCSWDLSKETDSRDCVSLLDNQFHPVGRCSTGGTRAKNGDHNYFGQPVANSSFHLRECDLEDVDDCDDNFVKLPLPKNKTADLKKKGKRSLEKGQDSINEENENRSGVGVCDNVRRARARKVKV